MIASYDSSTEIVIFTCTNKDLSVFPLMFSKVVEKLVESLKLVSLAASFQILFKSI